MTSSGMFEIRPDRSGPKNLGVLLVLGSLMVLAYGYADWNSHHVGLSDEEAETFILNPGLTGDEDITVADYRAFEDEARENSAFLIRAVSLLAGGLLVLVGGVFLLRLKRLGAYMCVAGAGLGLIGGVTGSLMIRTSARAHLGEALTLTYEIWVYICGAMMGLCLAMAALPLLNLRARMALEPLRLVQSEDSVPIEDE